MLISIFVYGDENAGAFRTNQVIMASTLVLSSWLMHSGAWQNGQMIQIMIALLGRCKFIPVFLDRISECPSRARS